MTVYGQRLSEHDVRQIVRLRGDGQTLQQIADQFDVTRENIRMIVDGRTWNNVTGLPRPDGSVPRPPRPAEGTSPEPSGPPQPYPWARAHCLAGGCDVRWNEPCPDGCRCRSCEPHLRLDRGQGPQIRARREQERAIDEPWKRIGPAGQAQMREWLTANRSIFDELATSDERES